MRIAKPILLISTPLGVAGGLFEAYRLAGGLVIVAAGMIALLGVAAATVIHTVRSEAAAELAKAQQPNGRSANAAQPEEQAWTATSK